MTDQQIIDALQHVHELTQQNAPESAGVAWAAFAEELIAHARQYPELNTPQVIALTLTATDIYPLTS